MQHVPGVPEGGRVPLHVLGDACHRLHRRHDAHLALLHGLLDRRLLLPLVRHGSPHEAAQESPQTVSTKRARDVH